MKKLIIILVSLFLMAGTAMAAGVTFRWSANTETDLAGYKLYQAETAGGPYTKAQVIGEGNLIGIISVSSLPDSANPEFTMPNRTDGQHYWVLTAYDLSNNESGFSNEVTTIIDTAPPAPPQGLSIWQIIVAWFKSIFSWLA